MAKLNRIVSLVPSTSKTLCDLGLLKQIVGITTFCVEPPELHKTATIVGGTKDPGAEQIVRLKPTHIFANTEENTQDIVDVLRARLPVHLSQPKSCQDVLCFLRDLPDFLQQPLPRLQPLLTSIQDSLDLLQTQVKKTNLDDKTFLYFIWDQPLMAAGTDTYISSLLEETGLRNALHGSSDALRYPSLNQDRLHQLRADFLLFSSEPFPFKKRHINPIVENLNYKPNVFKIDGRLLAWHGSLTAKALDELVKWQQGDRVRCLTALK